MMATDDHILLVEGESVSLLRFVKLWGCIPA
jgi:hypothetical protein